MTPHNNNTPLKIQNNLFDSSLSRARNLGKGSAGGQVMAMRLHREAIARHNANPKYCKQCGKLLVPHDEYHLQEVHRRKFCDRSCAAKFNNKGKRRHPIPKPKPCCVCGNMFTPKKRATQMTCGNKCASYMRAKSLPEGELLRRGFGDSAKSSALRKKQLALEEGIAEELRMEGWEIFSPTVVCDRVGVRDGQVFFLEFKPFKDQRLRPGQRRIADLVPEMYKIIAK